METKKTLNMISKTKRFCILTSGTLIVLSKLNSMLYGFSYVLELTLINTVKGLYVRAKQEGYIFFLLLCLLSFIAKMNE